MRYTLKELVDRILESLGGDEVNTISDTAESLAVANIIKECYFDIISEIQPKDTVGLFHLDSSGDNTRPTVMYLPSNVVDIKSLKYNVGDTVLDTTFRDLTDAYLPIDEFIDYMDGLDIDESWVDSQVVSINGQNFNFKFRNDESPSHWTSPDDRTILFDSYDSSYETTLTSSRTYGIGGLIPTFSMSDTYIPDLDPRHFQLLLNSAKAQAFVEIKQTANEKAEKKEKKHRALTYKTKDSTDPRSPINRMKGYGR